jgi:hypothetical protein
MDVARSDASTREAFEIQLVTLVETLANGPGDTLGVARAWALICLLSGAAAAARAVEHPGVRDAIINGAREAAQQL